MFEDDAAFRFELQGEWFLDRAAELHQLLVGMLAQIPRELPGGGRVEIDMSKVADLDASCCQLLVVFLRELRRRGVAPVLCGTSGSLAEKIGGIGFAEALAPSASGKEKG